MENETLLITLEAARVNKGYNIPAAAQKFGIHGDTLRKYEHDSTNVPRAFMVAVEDIYGIPLNNIFFGIKSEFFRINESAS